MLITLIMEQRNNVFDYDYRRAKLCSDPVESANSFSHSRVCLIHSVLAGFEQTIKFSVVYEYIQKGEICMEFVYLHTLRKLIFPFCFFLYPSIIKMRNKGDTKFSTPAFSTFPSCPLIMKVLKTPSFN